MLDRAGDSSLPTPCSFKLEGLGEVRDGSTEEIGIGYHMLGVTALTPGQKEPKRYIQR